MILLSITELRTRSGKYRREAQQKDFAITQYNYPVAVLISAEKAKALELKRTREVSMSEFQHQLTDFWLEFEADSLDAVFGLFRGRRAIALIAPKFFPELELCTAQTGTK
ncbi:type II toxin-antitoxin system Phd/YefM family antitoxin [Leptolyngbya sp. FACHB-541]|uniref:type II toxin-antitoxin system prevent-host-death family antitoxin n=1 Tax=Leptolyngbya sp. FACHB-541 TaxID=2692810 RepID=UPI0016870708|nr:type II toxin-antitoxin system prevent-host-death family antitoxin [Leptolyngbya sp. FACHB-541]MBD1995286.1 type II toxin-antitoxin system Phd/YefM family antitoxin [Leptolyngbya sp. FACHB-541]